MVKLQLLSGRRFASVGRLSTIGFASAGLISCGGGGGSDSTSPPPTPAAPTVSLAATPANAEYGADVVLNWSSTNASSCTASDGWSGSRSVSGQETSAHLAGSLTFTLTCTGQGGSAHQSATVTVQSLPPDPGNAGTATLAGVDSNGNGIRDDVERYVLSNTSPGGVRQALFAQAKLFQSALVQAPQPALLTSLMRNLECLYSYSPGDARAQSGKLLAEYLNTPERVTAYFNFAASIGPVTVDASDPADFAKSCGLT
jgi:hypothetical protein